MKKYLLDLRVKSVEQIHQRYVLIKLTDDKPLPEMLPGQFVEIRVDGSPNTFLRRPISINFVDTEANELWLLVAAVGDGTRKLAQLKPGDMLNCLLPLGNGFTMPKSPEERILLVGGGVGVAPLLYMGAQMAKMGCKPTFLLGARTAKDLLMQDIFKMYICPIIRIIIFCFILIDVFLVVGFLVIREFKSILYLAYLAVNSS